MDEEDYKKAIKLLRAVYRVREYQTKPSFANQGQCLEGYSSLHNYDLMADKIKTFLDKIE